MINMYDGFISVTIFYDMERVWKKTNIIDASLDYPIMIYKSNFIIEIKFKNYKLL